MTDQKAEHESEPPIHYAVFVSVADQCEAQPNLDERNDHQVTIHEKGWYRNPLVSLKQRTVILEETAVAKELTRAGS
jgi:hypothetical protein